MVGNPFEEGLRAPLALALLADRLSGQIPTLLLWSDLPSAFSRGSAGHDASFPLTATGGALVLTTKCGRKGWL